MVPAAGGAFIRVATYPTDLALPPVPHLATAAPDGLRDWLRAVCAVPEFAAAVSASAPQLALHVTRAVDGEVMALRQLRRLVAAIVRYLLRWTTRATPFGTFAGVAPVAFGARAAVRVGNFHRTVSRPDGEFVAEYTARAEQELAALRAVMVMTNPLGHRRGDRWVLPCARADADRRWDVEIGLTGPVRAAIQTARSPVGFAELAETIAGTAPVAHAEGLLAELIRVGVLLSAIRPAMTVVDPAAHLADRWAIPAPGTRIAVDQRADIAVTLPPAVLREAGRAASALTAVAPLLPGWAEYLNAFGERWGPGAAVPVRDVLAVLGFPAGYGGSTRRDPGVFTARDRLLGQLAQQAALDGGAEVVLDDALIDRLHGKDDRPPIPHTELRFALAADTVRDLDRGAFTLTVLSGSRHTGVAAGRFLHLLTPAEFAAFQTICQQLPTALPGAHTVQLSGPPLDAALAAVARVPAVLPVLPVGEFHPAPPWTVDDLAILSDGQRLCLVSRTTSRPVEPLLLNSVRLPSAQQPLIRFLAEIWTAWSAPCTRFDWGYADRLPFLPRVRRGRAILHPARWTLERTALPARAAPWPQWREAWQRHRDAHRYPPQVLVGDDDVQLRLDLDDDTHLAVLRDQLDRRARTVITEPPGPAGWIGGRPAELVLTLTQPTPADQTAPAARPARTVRPVRDASTVQHWPGTPGWLEAHLFGQLDAILADLARVADELPAGWWFLRYPEPAPHLRLRVPVSGTERFTATARALAAWAQELHTHEALHDYSLHPYRPETRHGTGPTLAAAEAVFAADSHAAVHRLTADRHAATAASMITIADGFTGDGLAWLAAHVPQRTGPRLDPAQLDRARVPFRDERLAAALADYRILADRDGLDPDQVLADLLHLHHARMIGVDTDSERHCLRLVRAIARTAHARCAP